MDSNVTLYKSKDIEVAKNSEFPEYLYLLQENFSEVECVELDEKDAKALYLILKNRFEV